MLWTSWIFESTKSACSKFGIGHFLPIGLSTVWCLAWTTSSWQYVDIVLLYCCCASDCSVASATSASCKQKAKHTGNQLNLMEFVSAHVSILHSPAAEGTSFQMPRPQFIINSISKHLQITCHPTHCEVRILTSNTVISHIFKHPETFASISSQLSTSCRRRLQTHSRIRDPPWPSIFTATATKCKPYPTATKETINNMCQSDWKIWCCTYWGPFWEMQIDKLMRKQRARKW